jgi:outer membrane protein assembly factor BamB
MKRLALAVLLASSIAPAQEIGWRRDGTGKYPAATPPTSWGRVSLPVKGLRYRASKPGPSDIGAPMADGVIREWLVLSPAPEGTKPEKETIPGEADLCPVEGEGSWKKVRLETAWMDFNTLIGKPDKSIACAATNVHSETGGKFRVNATQLAGFRILVNGKPPAGGYGRYTADLVKGWNRLLVKATPRDADWACTITFHAVAPAECENSNIAWIAPLPGGTGGFYGGGTGCGSPIIVKDRIYLLSEPHDLVCLDKASGKVLWVRTNSYFDSATDKDKKVPAYASAAPVARKLDELNATLTAGPLQKAALEEKVKLEGELFAKMQEVDGEVYKKPEMPDVGFSGLSPASDGKFIYLWLGTGVTACYDLDGKRQWIRVDNLPAVEHGFSSSPLLVDGKVVVFMRDLLAFEAATGRLAWRVPLVSHEGANPEGYFHGSPVRVIAGGVPLIALGNGTILRVSDGKILFTHPAMGKQAISSPVVEGDRLLLTSTWNMQLYIHTLPAAAGDPLKVSTQAVPVDTPGFPRYYLPWYIASPVVYEGLAYLLNNAGVLTVVDVKEAKVLYQKMLDLDHFQTNNEGPARGIGVSPTLAGKHLYLFGNNGGAVVLEPGRAFKQVAKNKIENIASIGHWGERQERFVSTPVFDGNRLYVRGEGHLYAIGR